jgi:hypothetical protein
LAVFIKLFAISINRPPCRIEKDIGTIVNIKLLGGANMRLGVALASRQKGEKKKSETFKKPFPGVFGG